MLSISLITLISASGTPDSHSRTGLLRTQKGTILAHWNNARREFAERSTLALMRA
jgi:hypothetical protein